MPPPAASCPRDDPLVRRVARRMRQPDLHPERRTEQRQRVVDVVAVADERDDEAVEAPEPLAHREDVGQRLAGVLAERQPVDDRDAGLRGQLERDLVRSRPHDDAVDEPLEVARHVAHALARPEHDVVGQVDRVTAELDHPGLERHPRPQARLLEQHRQRPPDERRRGMPARLPELALSAPSREDPPTSSADRSATLSRSARPTNPRSRHRGPPTWSCEAPAGAFRRRRRASEGASAPQGA